MAQKDDNPWYRSLLAGVGALVGVAILVGGVISLVALGAVSVTGIGETSSSPEAEKSLYIPERTGESDDPEDPGLTLADLNGGRDPGASESAAVEADESASPKDEPKRKKKSRSGISLSASPLTVEPMGQIYLSGTYPDGEGATLQVQRFEGDWTNFPTSASVSGGTFTTYVMTGQRGPNKFRVVDTEGGKKSNSVTVTVR